MIRAFLTRTLGLLFRSHKCADGPMQGETLILTENSNASAWIEIRGEIGRYVRDKDGRLTWERLI